jgi:hypothetical protein
MLALFLGGIRPDRRVDGGARAEQREGGEAEGHGEGGEQRAHTRMT